MKTKIIFLFLSLIAATSLFAQCDLPNQIEYLNANFVRAAVMNRGDNFWDLENTQYKVPYRGANSAATIFASNIWFGGNTPDGEKLVVANTYRNSLSCGYYPGPLDQGETSTSDESKENWNRIFKVSGDQIYTHLLDYSDGQIDDPLDEVFGWPARGNVHFEGIHGFPLPDDTTGMAPFHELPGSRNGIYEPEKGEFPLPPGVDPVNVPGEILFAVFNTAEFSLDVEAGIMPLYLEVRQTAWAFNCGDPILDQTIFFHYDVVNRGEEAVEYFRLGYWTDFDLGCYTDDYIGCDPGTNMAYVYNEDNLDNINDCAGGDVKGFGEDPPVQSIFGLGNELISFGYYNNPSFDHGPNVFRFESRESYHNLLYSKWIDGQPFTLGGDGYNPASSDFTDHLYPHPPNDTVGWSMASTNTPAGDRRAMSVFGSKDGDETLDAGEVFSYTLGFNTTRVFGEDHFGNVDSAIVHAERIAEYYENGFDHCQPEVCDCDCVWPGDTDANGKVDYLDAVNVFKINGQLGQPRYAPLAWTGTSMTDWPFGIPQGVNGKYVDADGDGEIGENDLAVIRDFIGESNSCLMPDTDDCEEGDDLWWDQVTAGRVIGDLRLERATLRHNIDRPIQGISLELSYDPEVIAILNRNASPDWSGGVESTTFYNEETTTDEHRDQFVIFNTDGQDIRLEDDGLLNIVFTDKAMLPDRYPTPTTSISICNGRVYYADGQVDTIRGQRLEFSFPDSVITSLVEEQALLVEVFPNPSTDEIQVKMGEEGKFLCTLINLQGRQVLSRQWIGNEITLDVTDLAPGAYVLKVQGEDRYSTRKVLIRK